MYFSQFPTLANGPTSHRPRICCRVCAEAVLSPSHDTGGEPADFLDLVCLSLHLVNDFCYAPYLL